MSKCQEMMTVQKETFSFLYHRNNYKLIGVGLSKQTNTSSPNKLILQENQKMVQQCFLSLKSNKKLFQTFF